MWIKDQLSPKAFQVFLGLMAIAGIWLAVCAVINAWPVTLATKMQLAILGGKRYSLKVSLLIAGAPCCLLSFMIAWTCDRLFDWYQPETVSNRREKEEPVAAPPSSPSAATVRNTQAASAVTPAVVRCRSCGRRVVLKADGQCPSCQGMSARAI